MEESKRTQLTVRQERALLVGVLLPGSQADPEDPLLELRSLAKTAGALVVDEVLARRQHVQAGTYIGSGKAEEIAARAQRSRADVVLFDNDLSPAQIRELEKVTARKVLDRSEVILDIFAATARSEEAKAQVELAQLEYTYPRLRHMWTHLERVAGGATTSAASVGGIGTRGPGEKQIEIDRRLLKKRVSDLKRRIAAIDRRRQRMVRARGEHFLACLVGYTNAGKSTLMNLLTGADVLVADRLFSTLDTRTRRWNLGDGTLALLSDTVGFIRDLPHHLVASFRATLEEVLGADLLVHVADASHPRVGDQIASVRRVLRELSCAEKDQLLVLNKIDCLTDPAVRTLLAGRYPSGVFISAATGENAEQVVSAVASRVRGRQVRVTLSVNYANGRLMQYLAHHARLDRQDYDSSKAVLEATLSERHLAGLVAFGKDVDIVEVSKGDPPPLQTPATLRRPSPC